MKEGVRSGQPVALPPPLPPGVGRVRPARLTRASGVPLGEVAVQAVDETAESTQKWEGADAAAAADAQANVQGANAEEANESIASRNVGGTWGRSAAR